MPDRPLPAIRPELRAFATYRVGGAVPPPDSIRLNANEWPEPTPADMYMTAAELHGVLLNRYPSAQSELRRILAEQYGVAPEQLYFGNGSTDTILQLLLVFGGQGRKVLLFMPTFLMHSRLAGITGATVAFEDIGLPYRVTKERALAAIGRERPEVVVFCTPNNPTGTLIDDDVILESAERFPETLVVVDEAYADIPGRTMLPALPGHPNIVISKTFSKVHAAAGMRLGVLIFHPDLAPAMRVVEYPSVSVVTYALAARIARDTKGIRRRIELIRSERERVYQALRRAPGVEPYPSEANFILFAVPGDPSVAFTRILEQGVLVRDMTPWRCPGCLRVSIGTPAENDRFIEALSSVFATAAA